MHVPSPGFTWWTLWSRASFRILYSPRRSSWYLSTITVSWYYNGAMIFRQAAAARISKNGRIAQKERTRSELLRAAGELLRAGSVPTVSDVADAARISRTTAYRYFPTQELLLAEATADPLIESVNDAIAAA